MIYEPQEPCRSVAPMTATDLGFRNTFNCSFATTVLLLVHRLFSISARACRNAQKPHLDFDENLPFLEESIGRTVLFSKEKLSTKQYANGEKEGIGEGLGETVTSIRGG